MRKVFSDELPIWESGLWKGKINWKESIGYKVEFIYDDIEGQMEIINYTTKGQYLYIKYKDEPTYKIRTSDFLRCRIYALLGKRKTGFKIGIGTHLKNDTRDLIVIDREYRDNPNNKGKKLKYCKYKCNKCGWEEGWKEESSLLTQKQGCACCSNYVVVQGINDIPTTASWMVKFFQGGYNEAKLYTRGSHKRIHPVCPDCGRIKDKEKTIADIYNEHSIGCSCGDGIPYTENLCFPY